MQALVDYLYHSVTTTQKSKAKAYWQSPEAETTLRRCIHDLADKRIIGTCLIKDTLYVQRKARKWEGGVAFAGKRYTVSAKNASDLYIAVADMLDAL